MQSVSIHPPENFQVKRWKNGLGETIELLAKTAPGCPDFCWRLSIASVTSNDLFSSFSEYDRTLILIEGEGITLSHAHTREQVLSKRLDLAHFMGEHKTTPRLHKGAIKDFNIITRRDYCHSKTTVLTQEKSIDVDSDFLFVYALDETTCINSTSSNKLPVTDIAREHLLQVKSPAHDSYRVTGGAAIVVQIYIRETAGAFQSG